MTLELGDKAKDRVTGLTGIVTGIHLWLHGCRRITLQPQELKDGKPVDSYCLDEPQCELLERAVVKIPQKHQELAPKPVARTGGPPTSGKAGSRPSVKR